jgi:hypothetical protein
MIVDAVVSLPYITAKGNASATTLRELNYENERSGLQDISAFLKYNPYSTNIGSSKLDFAVGLGVRTSDHKRQ